MPIPIICSSCGKRLKARDELAGKRLPCPGCSQMLLVPVPEEEAAGPLPSAPPSRPRSREPGPRDEPAAAARPSRSAARKPGKDLPAPVLPLRANETPVWLRHAHWLLILCLVPLAVTLLDHEEKDSLLQHIAATVDDAPPEVQERCEALAEEAIQGKMSRDEFCTLLCQLVPENRLKGALLPRDSYAHWAFAAGAAILFMGFFLLLAADQTANPLHLLGIGLFTATIGILLLLLLQIVAAWSQNVWITGRGIIALLFYIVKFIGFSYRAALDPGNGFFLSFMGFTLGVGFCEEVCKALPLLWYYRQPREHSWRMAFLWGLASGAGFGISEGITYAGTYYNGIEGADIYFVRFLSCVALHALWTGSVAITLHQVQGLIQGDMHWYEYIPPLFAIVGVPMVLHGLYDTLLKKDMNAGALVVALLSFGFLAFLISRLHGADDDEARRALLRDYKRRRVAMS